jgi:hypothetical protein
MSDTGNAQKPWTYDLAFSDFMLAPDAHESQEMRDAWIATVGDDGSGPASRAQNPS